MIRIFRYGITLLDALFYSREGLSGAITPKYLHATAVNHAAAYALGINPENQPYIISENNGGRNVPRYENSLICGDFYFTPARPKGTITYQPEIAKGEEGLRKILGETGVRHLASRPAKNSRGMPRLNVQKILDATSQRPSASSCPLLGVRSTCVAPGL